MKSGDFLFYTLASDTADPQTTYVAQIYQVDPGSGVFSCRELNTGQDLTMQVPAIVSQPWDAQDSSGATVTLNTHDIYTAGGTSPVAQGVALVTFGDGNHYLCSVDSISPTTDIVFYQSPNHRMSLDGEVVKESDWDAYPVGDQIVSIEAYVPDTSLGQPAAPSFQNGWWSLAQRTPAFADRIGGAINPFAVVVHTTDMTPESFNDLVHSWTTQLGPGDCAHFIIGRDAGAGLLQLAPITSNGNHAGGDGHGSFVAGAQEWHPNSVSVGIEVHCAGIVHMIAGVWRWVDTDDGVAKGNPIPDADVIHDPDRPGVGYHKVTDYQYQQLGLLLDGLEAVLQPLPEGCVARSIEQPPAWGVFATGRRVGHVSLHAAARSDPWKATCDWMRNR